MVSHSKLLGISLLGIGANRKQRNIYLTLCVEFPPKCIILLAPVIQMLDSSIDRKNHYPVDKF